MDIILSAFEYPFVGLFLFSLYVWGNGHFIGYWWFMLEMIFLLPAIYFVGGILYYTVTGTTPDWWLKWRSYFWYVVL